MKQVFIIYYSKGKTEPKEPLSRIYDYEQQFLPTEIISARNEDVCKNKMKIPKWAKEYKIINIGWENTKGHVCLWDKYKYELQECTRSIIDMTDIEWLPYLPTALQFST